MRVDRRCSPTVPEGRRPTVRCAYAGAMNRRLPMLLAGFVLGLASVFVTSFGLMAIAVMAVVVFAIGLRKRWFDFLGAYLLGFGLLWAFLVGRWAANGAPQSNDLGWVVFGVAVVAIGALLLLVAHSRPDTFARS